MTLTAFTAVPPPWPRGPAARTTTWSAARKPGQPPCLSFHPGAWGGRSTGARTAVRCGPLPPVQVRGSAPDRCPDAKTTRRRRFLTGFLRRTPASGRPLGSGAGWPARSAPTGRTASSRSCIRGAGRSWRSRRPVDAPTRSSPRSAPSCWTSTAPGPRRPDRPVAPPFRCRGPSGRLRRIARSGHRRTAHVRWGNRYLSQVAGSVTWLAGLRTSVEGAA